ncbi:MAG: TetR/AcrR family transcriptional regulator [Bacteroidia bacterium]
MSISASHLPSDPVKSRIIQHAWGVFTKRGVRSVTMDEIARDLGMSKKTLYQHFANKAAIVMAVSTMQCTQEQVEIDAVCVGAKDAVDELLRVMSWVSKMLTSISPNLIPELKKYYPEAWEMHADHSDTHVINKLSENLQRGKEEGLYRSDVNVDLVARIRAAQIDTGFNEHYFPSKTYNQLTIQRTMLEVFLYGITTPKGRELIRQYFRAYKLV